MGEFLHHIMNTPKVLLWLGLFVLSTICQAELPPTPASDPGAAVVLKPFHVGGGAFDVDCTLKNETQTIQKAIVTYIAPGLKKQGLREGIALISINGKSVDGLPVAKFHELMQHELKAGETDTFIFAGKRGLFGKKQP